MARIKKNLESLWRVAIYIRLSKEDGNDESLSVTNQKKILLEYLEKDFQGTYLLKDCYIDDGATGTDYERPDFQRMIHDMESGAVNCIVCKNLSRMFRNYSDQGYFLEKIFPMNNLRFITLSNPKLDSYLRPEELQGLEVPINGLMNDRFAAKTSRDIRDTFNTKRRKGEFIGAFAPYGYRKDPSDKNRLVIDEEAAQTVRSIFQWYVKEGMSKNGIAKQLNASRVPNPTAYKQGMGLLYCHPQDCCNDGLWSTSTIAAVLKNRMYTGAMVQGKQTVISYKIHHKVATPEDAWFIVEGTHEPVIDKGTFDLAQSLQTRNTRAAPKSERLHLFAGFLRCADCQKAMTRQKTKGQVYYYCRTFRDKSRNACTKHTVKEEAVTQAVLLAIQREIPFAQPVWETAGALLPPPHALNQQTQQSAMAELRQKELDKIINRMDRLYDDWKNGDLTREEYHRLKIKYEAQKEQSMAALERLKKSAEASPETGIHNPLLTAFLNYRNISRLERGILAHLVNQIDVHETGALEIEFLFVDRFRKAPDLIHPNS